MSFLDDFLDLPHIGFVIAAYAIAALVVALLIGATLFDHRAVRRALAPYEARGRNPSGPDAASE
ncbi:MAG: heme exporter protein CcmD [Hyphomicrobiales bacterium]